MPLAVSESRPRTPSAPAGGAADAGHQRRLLKLFRLSVLKQRKWREIARLLGPTGGLRGLEIGADNGVISYLLRQQGGRWTSADLDAQTVEAIRAMVGSDVVQLGGGRTPFADGEFDRVVLIDCLEHLPDDQAFIKEMARITKPGGEMLVNVPFPKRSWLRRVRLAIGQTDEAHGHVRHGYTLETLTALLGPSYALLTAHTYSKCFSEAVDTLITWGTRRVKRQPAGDRISPVTRMKGTLVTGDDLAKHQRLLQLYTALYPILWAVAQLDRLLWFRSGYMLIAKVRRV